MDFLESAFKYLVQKGPLKKDKLEQSVFFDAIQKRLEILNHSCSEGLNSNFTPSLVPGRDFIGGHLAQIYLPEKMDYFSNKDLNAKAYLVMLLIIRAAPWKQNSQFGPLQQRFQFLNTLQQAYRRLDQQYPNFKSWQYELVHEIKKKEKSNDHLRILDSYLSRETIDMSGLRISTKKNAQADAFVRAILPHQGYWGLEESIIATLVSGDGKSKNQNQSRTEKKKSYQSKVDRVDLEKEKANPVTHSFEKMETADDYQGGRRFDSGDDELESHLAALDELDLSKMTTGGETAKSIFRSDEQIEKNQFISSELPAETQPQCFFYDEWNYRKRSYLRKHCRVLFQFLDKAETAFVNLNSEQIRQVRLWRGKINALLSKPLILKRMKEGDEVDIDEVVRDWPDLKNKRTIQGRWYMSKRPQLKDAAIVILVDQSMSSDSWVANKRVMDVMRDSLMMSGEIFKDILDTVQILGISSQTHKNIYIHCLKDFDEDWLDLNGKLAAVEPSGYTRLGPGIRHATYELLKRKEQEKILILLTDGKPTDLDGYEGQYGIQDVRQAFFEAEGVGIKSYALAVDSEAKNYFEKMFVQFNLLIEPDKMAEHIFKILFRLIKNQ